jgi:YidC/Oxa1 family membrane protein insertase
MIKTLWNAVLYKPLYNALIFLVAIIPGGDIGIALIVLTIVVKLILFPLTQKSIKSQVAMKQIEPELAKIKAENLSREEQARRTMELYKTRKVNPFSGCLVLLIQFPIIIALYQVFFKGLAVIAPENLYSFVHLPTTLNTMFLGLIDMHAKSVVLAVLAGITQFIQMKIVMPQKPTLPKPTENKTFSEQMSQSMQFQMRYILPVFITFVAYSISSAVALYWVTSNIVTIIQEIFVRRKIARAQHA